MRELVCIACPKGCRLMVDKDFSVSGNSCDKGEVYGRAEVQYPLRAVSSTVKVEGGLHPRCPVKTTGTIPKALMIEAVRALRCVAVRAPVREGQVIVADVCGSGVDIVATRDIPSLQPVTTR